MNIMGDRYSVGVDVGGSHVSCAVVDLRTASIVEGSMVNREVDSSRAASEMLSAWGDAVRRSVELSGVRPRRAGFAFPGPFDYRLGVSMIAGVGKFERIFGLDVAASLGPRLRECGIERSGFVNDAAAFALGESVGGAARGVDRVVALTLGTGFGSGFVSGGRLVVDGASVPPDGWVYRLPFEGGIADDAFSTRWLCGRYAALTGGTVTGAREIAERAEADPAARRVFEEYGRRLGGFVAPICRRFGGGAIVVGGNISRAFHLFAEAMNAALARAGVEVEVRRSTLRAAAAITGAAMLHKTF